MFKLAPGMTGDNASNFIFTPPNTGPRIGGSGEWLSKEEGAASPSLELSPEFETSENFASAKGVEFRKGSSLDCGGGLRGSMGG